MGQHTSIEWCDHTFNPWWGCTKVAEGCRNCYAEALDVRWFKGAHWGPGAERRALSEANWTFPCYWDRDAERHGVRRRVFCGSMCDVLDPDGYEAARRRLWSLIEETPHLDWLLLSKRPQLYRETFERLGCPDNIWAGASASTQSEFDTACRHLQYLPTRVEFLSLEPLIERIVIPPLSLSSPGDKYDGIADRIDWVIVGGESGPGARPCDTEWIERIVRQCGVHRIPVFVKQLGANYSDALNGVCGHGTKWPYDMIPSGPFYRLKDPKGGDMAEWFEHLRVRQVPDGQAVWP